ncbi:MAG: HigA family addiction module antitoxin [Methylococcaceae bacterium]
MFNPPHPASILRDDIFPELGMTVTQAAKQLSVSRVQLSRVLNERAGISPDLALRLEQWLGNTTAETWLKMQLAFDSWHVQQKGVPQVKPLLQKISASKSI